MQFAAQRWVSYSGAPHCVVKVTFDSADIAQANTVASQKLNYINVHAPGGSVRNPMVIRNRIIAGKLADAAVTGFLEAQIKANGLSNVFLIEEYDAVRTDAFMFPDPYDIKILKSNGTYETVEVRSSFSYLIDQPQKIINKFSIYGWYTTQTKPNEPRKDWYWQFIYHLRPQDIPQSGNLNINVFEDQLQKNQVIGYIVGGASHSMLVDQGEVRPDQDRAFYQAISPITDGHDYCGMLESMFGIPRNPRCI